MVKCPYLADDGWLTLMRWLPGEGALLVMVRFRGGTGQDRLLQDLRT